MIDFVKLISISKHIANNRIQYNFAIENFSDDRLKKLLRSSKQLIIFQIVPWLILLIFFIAVFIFIPAENVPNGYASTRETIILFGTAFYLLFWILWLILSQFLVGKLWHKYIKWFNNTQTKIEEINIIIDNH